MIFPNPFSSETTLKTTKNLTDASLLIFNTLGQQVERIININDNEISINHENLSEGIYFIRLTQNSKIVFAGKVFVGTNY